MTAFLLNDRLIESPAPPGTPLLDVIRYEQRLTGTKIGCREGDCGACTILLGTLRDGRIEYRTMTSCLLALASVHGRHVVTVEGVTMPGLSPVQRAMVDAHGTQCGFCTPGFVVSLSSCCLSPERVTPEAAVRSVDGNICRCTGYASIVRAARAVAASLEGKSDSDPVAWSVERGMVPAWFLEAPARLRAIAPAASAPAGAAVALGGGTDLYVQQHDALTHAALRPVAELDALRGIRIEDGHCVIGGAAVVTDLLESELMQRHFPRLEEQMLRISSTPIRNMGTLAGNFVNASPIGDLTAFFLALGSVLTLRSRSGGARECPLASFFLGYKRIDLADGELIESVRFALPGPHTHVGFEKVSKRTMLDIASVNSGACIDITDGVIRSVRLSAGGVAPVPLLLRRPAAMLVGKPLTAASIRAAAQAADEEIAPISDARGSAEYKRLLLRQLIIAHFVTLFPGEVAAEALR